jgi:RimJ/RimL family protein N-acetyltransferase
MRPSRFLRETVTLRDGRKVVIRPIDPSDAPRLIALHNKLSAETQYFRFFGPKPRLTVAESEYLANVDFHRRFAIVGEVKEEDEVALVGVARFDIDDADVAEAAIVVRDDYQHVGLGTEILLRIREVGRGAGLSSFRAEVLAENARMIELLEANGYEVTSIEGDVVKISAPLELPVMMRGLRVGAQFADALGKLLPKLP